MTFLIVQDSSTSTSGDWKAGRVQRCCSRMTLQLLELSKVALRGHGIPPRQLIETTKAHYPATRGWAEQVYAAHPHLQGFLGPRGRMTGRLR